MNEVWRYETKIVVKEASVANLLNEIHLNPLMFRPLFAPRKVNNLYFDTLDLDFFHDHIYGYTKRAKVRLRWYGEFGNIENAVLEIKKKVGTVGTKLSFPVSGQLKMEKNISLFELLKRTQVPAQLRESLSNLVPSLYNRYHRSYFISANEKVRLTLDQQVSHKDIYSTVWVDEPDDLKIIEFKYNQNEFFDGERALKNFSFVQDKSSKYIRGLLRIT